MEIEERDVQGRFMKGNPGGPGRSYKHSDKDIEALAKNLIQWVEVHQEENQFMLLGDWAFANSFCPAYFARYSKRSPAFKEAYEYAKAWQEHCVSKGALNKTLDSKFSAFFLGCNHGWKTDGGQEDKEHKLRSKLEELVDCLKNEDDEE